MSQVLVDTESYTSLLNYVMFASKQITMSEYVTTVKEWKKKLLFESKFEGKEQQLDITEGDIFMDIQEVWVETISIEISTAVSREISRVIAKEKERKVEEGN